MQPILPPTYSFQSPAGEDIQNWLHFCVEVEELVLLDLSGDVDASFLGNVRLFGWTRLEIVGLDFDVDFWLLFVLGVLEEEVEIGLYLWVGSGFNVIWSHLLLVAAEIC